MGLLLTLIAGLAIWIVLWAIGVKGFDAFMIPVLLVLVAIVVRLISPYLPGNRARDDDSLAR